MPEDVTELIDLRYGVNDPAQRRILCDAFYSQVYRHAFTKPDQTETPEVWLPLLNEDRPPPHPLLHIIVAYKATPHRAPTEPKIFGGVVMEYFRRSRAVLITYIAVHPDSRRTGLARQLLTRVFAAAKQDNAGTMPLVLAEIENPGAQKTSADRKTAKARVGIFRALGGARIDLNYVQPRLSADQHPVCDLDLILLSPPSAMPSSLPSAQVRMFLTEFFSSLQQADSAELRNMLESLPNAQIATRML